MNRLTSDRLNPGGKTCHSLPESISLNNSKLKWSQSSDADRSFALDSLENTCQLPWPGSGLRSIIYAGLLLLHSLALQGCERFLGEGLQPGASLQSVTYLALPLPSERHKRAQFLGSCTEWTKDYLQKKKKSNEQPTLFKHLWVSCYAKCYTGSDFLEENSTPSRGSRWPDINYIQEDTSYVCECL